MATTSRDYYEILSVSRTATAEEIKRSYRKLAREKHPDVNAHRRDHAEAEFKEIGEAYAVLSDDVKRSRYDQFGHAGVDGAGVDFGGAGGFGDLFEVFFGGGGGGGMREQIRRGSDLRMNVRLTLEQSYAGVTKDLEIPTLLTCETCHGEGAAPGTETEKCSACKGSGRLREVRQSLIGQMVQEVPCARCGGRGRTIKTPCPTCHGEGRTRGKRHVKVAIPAGVDEGDRVRVTGAGEDGEAGAQPGDLYCMLYIEEHATFQRHDESAVYAMPLSFVQATLGDVVTVPTLEIDSAGNRVEAQVTVPAGTQNGAQFKVSGKGFPARYGQRGDQVCVARVTVPTRLTDRQKELLREFAEIADEQVDEHPRGFFDKLKDVFTPD